MKLIKSFAFILVAIVFGAELRAATVATYSITNNFVNVNNRNFPFLTWEKFNPAWGTLSGISFRTTNNTISGSFGYANLSTTEAATVTKATSVYSFSFLGGFDVFPLNLDPVSTTQASDWTETIPAQSFRNFEIGVNQNYANSSFEWFSNSSRRSYFTGIGNVQSVASHSINITSTQPRSAYEFNTDNVNVSGTAILTYTYTIPEPSALSLLAVGLGVVLRRRRRTV